MVYNVEEQKIGLELCMGDVCCMYENGQTLCVSG
jgi:hypothetical protein